MGRFSSQTITKNDEDETDSAKTEDTSKPQEENELGGKSSKIFPNLTQCELEFIFIAATAAPSTGKKYSKTKSWKNSKYTKEQNKEGATTTEKEDSTKVYSTREFRRSNSGQKRTSPSNKADSNATSEQETAHQEPKRSGKSYASKRKERQQQKKEASKANSEDGILDLPSE